MQRLHCCVLPPSFSHTFLTHRSKFESTHCHAASALLRFTTLFLEDGVVPLSAAASRTLSCSVENALSNGGSNGGSDSSSSSSCSEPGQKPRQRHKQRNQHHGLQSSAEVGL